MKSGRRTRTKGQITLFRSGSWGQDSQGYYVRWRVDGKIEKVRTDATTEEEILAERDSRYTAALLNGAYYHSNQKLEDAKEVTIKSRKLRTIPDIRKVKVEVTRYAVFIDNIRRKTCDTREEAAKWLEESRLKKAESYHYRFAYCKFCGEKPDRIKLGGKHHTIIHHCLGNHFTPSIPRCRDNVAVYGWNEFGHKGIYV